MEKGIIERKGKERMEEQRKNGRAMKEYKGQCTS